MTKKSLIIPILALITSLIACQKNTPLTNIEGQTMGTTYHISYYDTQNRNLKPQIDSVLLQINHSLSTYDKTSLISIFNAADSTAPADDYLQTVFKKGQEVSKATNGVFDLTVMPLVAAWGFGAEKRMTNIDSNKIDSLRQLVGYKKVSLKNNQLYKTQKNVRIDVDGIAQGFGVDELGRYLDTQNINSYLVEIGGELTAKGKKMDGTPWTVGIEKPLDNDQGTQNPMHQTITLENEALSTSGNYRKFFIENGQKYAHEINPKTGYPELSKLLAVSIIAADCMTADAYATALMVMGLEQSIEFLKTHAELKAILIYDDKGQLKTHQTDNIQMPKK